MSANSRQRKEQHEKLKALIQPLGEALEIEPADAERQDEAEIWEEVNDLYGSLTDFFDELAGPESTAAPTGEPGTIAALLAELSDGKCPGVKGATAYKIQKYAAERGYV